MDLTTIALRGLQQADAQLGSAASKIATSGATAPAGATQDTVDLSDAVVALLSAKNLYAANLGTVKTADEVLNATFDLIA